MTSSREAFLRRVRDAVAEGNRSGGGAPPLPERGNVGYQGAGDNPVQRLREQATAAGATVHTVADSREVPARIREILSGVKSDRILVGDGLDHLDLREALPGSRVERVADLAPDQQKEAFFAADVGITSVDAVIAETGTVVQKARENQPRSVSLLVPVHIAVVRRKEILADLFDLFRPGMALPSCLTLITGPSKTGDIELRLVTGVHGPGEVHLIVVEGEGS